jgi:hypothetical protein
MNFEFKSIFKEDMTDEDILKALNEGYLMLNLVI